MFPEADYVMRITQIRTQASVPHRPQCGSAVRL
jgi:hypothetical protein